MTLTVRDLNGNPVQGVSINVIDDLNGYHINNNFANRY
jgi:hypothetical protein